MKLELRMKYLETVYQRYRKSSKESKGKILDELCEVCKYNRKYAIWKISHMPMEEKHKARPKRKRPRKYDHQVLEVLEKIWNAANYPWSLRLKEIIRLWLPWIRVRYRIPPEVEEKLLSISPSTIDRALKPKKIKLKRRLYGRTKPGTLLRHKIPVRTDTWDVKRFHKVSSFNDALLVQFFTREIFSLLLRKQLINLSLVQKILRWRYTGFHVHSKVRAESKEETEQVGKYMIRPILSLRRLSLDEAHGQVIYQYGKHSTEAERMDYLEFIARVTPHIPDKGQVMIRYYGLYANAHRGKKKKAGVDSSCPPIIGDEASFIPSRGWANMIRKVYEVDPLLCPRCGGQMSIIAFIEEHKVIDKIINHLKLTFHAERPPPPQLVQQELMMAAEEEEKYF